MAERSGWGTATDKPTGGSADPNILTLGDQTRFRILDPAGPVKWRQHYVESPTDPDQGRSVVCPRGPDGRLSLPCPLCMKPVDAEGQQQFNISRRFATNVWDYETGTVKVLIAGPKVFQEFDAIAKAGIDPTSADWSVIKSGTGKGTQYTTVRLNPEPFTAATIGPDDLHDLDKYADPDSPERILEVVEAMGIDYDALELPSYTLGEAESVQMPYGKHKGMTIEQLYVNEKDYLQFIYGQKRGDGNYGDPIFVAMHTVLEHYGDAKPLEELTAMQSDAPTASAAAANGAPSPGPAPGGVRLIDPSGMEQEVPEAAVDALLNAGFARIKDEPTSEGTKTLIGPDGKAVEVPQAAVEAMLGAGFTDPTAAASEPEPGPPYVVIDGQVTLTGPDGKEITVPESAAQSLIDSGFEPVGYGDDPEPEPPTEPSDDTLVTVQIGDTSASMPYGSAKGLIAAGQAKLLGPVVETPAPAAPVKQAPADDAEVMFKLKVMPSAAPPVKMKWSDASRLYGESQGDFQGNEDGYSDEELRSFAIPTDAAVKEEAAEAAAQDPHPPAVVGTSSAPAGPGPTLDGEPTKGDDGKWGHPALDKPYATKGSATQALNRLRKAAEASGTAQPEGVPAADAGPAPEGKAGKLEHAKKLVAASDVGDFKVLMDLFEEVANKRNIAEFTEPELDKLIAKLS